MSIPDSLGLPMLDVQAGTITLSFILAGALAILVVLLAALAVFRAGARAVIATVAAAAVIAAALGIGMTLISRSDRAEERRALDRRLSDLTAGALAPGSALACLDAGIGEAVEGFCEKAVFASPETLAAATAFVNARLNLLADGLDYAARGEPAYENALAGIRRALEADRFGLVAQVLASRDGCTPAKCDAFQWLRDASRIRTNLNEHTYDNAVARNSSGWQTRGRSGAPVAAAPAVAPALTTITFPPAPSVAPTGMNGGESAAPVTQVTAAPPAPAAAPPAPRRAPPRTAQRRPAPAVQLGPASQSGGGQSRVPQP